MADPKKKAPEATPPEGAPAPEITELKCKCGETVSGPNVDSVKATMDRHKRKAHGR